MSILNFVALAAIIATGAAVRDQGTIQCGDIKVSDTASGVETMGQRSPEHSYRFTVGEAVQNIVFDTCGSLFDTYLHVHRANGTLVRSDDDTGGCGLQTVTAAAYPAGDYVLTLEGYSTREGEYTLKMLCPALQAIDNNPDTAACGGTYSSDTLFAQNLVGNSAGDHFYTISLAYPTILTLDACESDYDNYVRVFSGTCTSAPCTAADFGEQLYARDDGGCASNRGHRYNSLSSTPLLAAGDYTIVMEGFSSGEGHYNLTIGCEEQIPSTLSPGGCAPDEHRNITTQSCDRNSLCLGHEVHENDVTSDCFRLKLNYQTTIEVSSDATASTTSADYFREVPGLDRTAQQNEHVSTPRPSGDNVALCAREHARGLDGICTCTGTVHYGMQRGSTHRWSVHAGADGSYRCANSVFGDPWRGVVKVCYCEEGTTTAGAEHPNAVSIESCSMPGKFLAVGTVSAQATTVRLLERDEFPAGWFDRAATWKKTMGHSGLLAGRAVAEQDEGDDTVHAVAYETLTRAGYFLSARENSGLRLSRVTSRNTLSVANSALFTKVSDRKVMVQSDQFDHTWGYCRGASWRHPTPTRWATYASVAEAQAGCVNEPGCTAVQVNQHGSNSCRAIMYFHHQVGAYRGQVDGTVACYIRQVEAVDSATSLSAATAEVNDACPTVSSSSIAGCESNCAFPQVDTTTPCVNSMLSAAIVTHARRTDGVITSTANGTDGCPVASGMVHNCYRSCVAACAATIDTPDPSECVRLTSRNYGYGHRAGLRPPIRAQLDRPGFDIARNGYIDDFSQETFRFVPGLLNAATPGLGVDALSQVISVESCEQPGRFLMAKSGNLAEVGMADGSSTFATAATFVKRDGEFTPDYFTLEPMARRGTRLRHQGYKLKLHRRSTSLLYTEDASFHALGPAAPFDVLDYQGVETTVCEHARETITCPTGTRMTINEAWYGRRDMTTCRTTRCPGTGYCRILNSWQNANRFPAPTHCFANATNDLRLRCDGQISCNLHASNGVYGDPCRGTLKYMHVSHTCTRTGAELDAAETVLDGQATEVDLATNLNFEYVSENATAVSDRVCTTCGRCMPPYYIAAGCSEFAPTQCETAVLDDTYVDVPDLTAPLRVQRCGTEQYESAVPTLTSDRECNQCDSCGEGRVMVTDCTGTANRVCRDVEADGDHFSDGVNDAAPGSTVSICGPGTAVDERPTASSDRTCYACVVDINFAAGDNSLTCVEVTPPCSSDHYEAAAPTVSTDRRCELLAVCVDGQYESVPAQDDSNRECEDLAVCVDGQFESVPAEEDSNRECEDLTECTYFVTGTVGAGSGSVEYQFELAAPTDVSNRVCEALRTCEDTEWESKAPTDTTDRVCTPHPICTGDQYKLVEGSSFVARVCVDHSTCDDTAEYEIGAPTDVEDRVCAELARCDDSNQYESIAPTSTSNRVCEGLARCVVGVTYMTIPHTYNTDRTCSDVATCDYNAQYQSVAPLWDVNRECTNLAICTPGDEFESVPKTDTTDRNCTAVRTCTVGVEWMVSESTYDTDRDCKVADVCVSGRYGQTDTNDRWQFADMTPTTDRDCRVYLSCGATEYETVEATPTSDRSCEIPTPCDAATQFTTSEFTATSNRQCGELTVCNTTTDAALRGPWYASTQFESVGPGQYTDRECAPATVCQEVGIQYQVSELVEKADRVCANVTECDIPGEYELTAPTATADRLCGAPTLLFPNDFDTLFPADDRAVHIADFKEQLTLVLRNSLQELTPPSLIAVYEGSTLVTIQYENESTTDALGALAGDCGIALSFNGIELFPSPIESAGACTPEVTLIPNIAIGAGIEASTADDKADETAAGVTTFVAIGGVAALVAMVALIAITADRNGRDTSGKPITEDADASSLNPLYSAPTGQFSHDDRGTASAIAGRTRAPGPYPADSTYDSVNYSQAKHPRPGDVNYEAYYDDMQRQNRANDTTYSNDNYGILEKPGKRASVQLESGYTFGTGAEATYDLGGSDETESPAYAIGADYAAATVAEPTYDIGDAQEAVTEPTYDMGAADEDRRKKSAHVYGMAADAEVATRGDNDMIYDNSAGAQNTEDEPVYGLKEGRRSISYGDALDEAPPASNIDAVY